MLRAIEYAMGSRRSARPNPWVGALLRTKTGEFMGRTQRPGGAHAEIDAMAKAGNVVTGSSLSVTLEPCSYYGRTRPCVDAIINGGISSISISIVDPDENVSGNGIRRLVDSHRQVTLGEYSSKTALRLAPYIKQRLTKRPWVVAKIAMTLDGRVAASDGSSKWITSDLARYHAHQLRADSDAIIVGANTVRIDNPRLDARDASGRPLEHQPQRIVLGDIPDGSAVLPATSYSGDLGALLDGLGSKGFLQVMVEGGPRVISEFFNQDLVDQYSIYFAPAIFGSAKALSAFDSNEMVTMADIWRGRLKDTLRLGDDVYLEVLSMRAIGLLEKARLAGKQIADELGLAYVEDHPIEEELCLPE